MSMKKILIVEDEPDEARSMQLILKNEKFKTTTVKTVKSAEKKLKKEKFNLILLDIILPYELGTKLLEKMIKEKNNIPTIVITAISKKFTSIKKDIKKINPEAGFLSKPFTSKKLLNEIKKYIK